MVGWMGLGGQIRPFGDPDRIILLDCIPPIRNHRIPNNTLPGLRLAVG